MAFSETWLKPFISKSSFNFNSFTLVKNGGLGGGVCKCPMAISLRTSLGVVHLPPGDYVAFETKPFDLFLSTFGIKRRQYNNATVLTFSGNRATIFDEQYCQNIVVAIQNSFSWYDWNTTQE
uniref:Uncharacterized protein n=1 Tax=Glossina pallidipes TaxID=7398 RepID=A0A1A9ZHH5_GLOPL